MAMHRRGGFPPRSGPPPGEEAAREKAMRSIFGEKFSLSPLVYVILVMFAIPVANVAFETTEEQLRPILSEVGPVVNLK